MKVTGNTAKPTERAFSDTSKAKSTTETGPTTKLRAEAPTHTQTEPDTKANGDETSKTGKVRRPGQTAPGTLATMSKARRQESASTFGLMVQSMKESGART